LDGEKALPGGLGGMSASANGQSGQKAEIAGENCTESMPRTLNSSGLTPPFPSYGIQAIKIALAMSFGHHP
jgi:hypothetical protein